VRIAFFMAGRELILLHTASLPHNRPAKPYIFLARAFLTLVLRTVETSREHVSMRMFYAFKE
jgi:hypothetical protein